MRFSVENERETYRNWALDASRYCQEAQKSKIDYLAAQNIYKKLIAGDYHSEYQYFRALAYEPDEVKQALVKLCGTKNPGSYIKHPIAFKHTIDDETYEHYKIITSDIDYLNSSQLYALYQEIEPQLGVSTSRIASAIFLAGVMRIQAKASPTWDFDCDVMIGIPAEEVTETLKDLKNYCQTYNRKISKQNGLLACSIGTFTIYFYTDISNCAEFFVPLLLPKTLAGMYLGAINYKLQDPEQCTLEALAQIYFEHVFVSSDLLDIHTRVRIIKNSAYYLLLFVEDCIVKEQQALVNGVTTKILPTVLSSSSSYQEFMALYQNLNPSERFAYKDIAEKYQLNRKISKLKNYHSRPERKSTDQTFKHSVDQARRLRDKFLAKLETVDIESSSNSESKLYKHRLDKEAMHEKYSHYFCENFSCLIQLDENLDDESLAEIALLIKAERLTLIDRDLLCFELANEKSPIEVFIIFGEGLLSAYNEFSGLNNMAYDYYYAERPNLSLESKLKAVLTDNSNQVCALVSELNDSDSLELKVLLDNNKDLADSFVKSMHSTFITEDTTNQINLPENQRIFSKLAQGEVIKATGKRHKRFNKIYSDLLWRLEAYTQKFNLLVGLGDKYDFAMGAFITIPRTIYETEFIEALALLIKDHGYELITISGCLALKKKGCIFYCMYDTDAEISAYAFCQTQMEAMLNSRRKLVEWQPSANLTKILMEAKT